MKKYKLLILTDTSMHSKEDSLYPLLREMLLNSSCKGIYLADRAKLGNKHFYDEQNSTVLELEQVDEYFAYSTFREKATFKTEISYFDLILFRLPRPYAVQFVSFFGKAF